MNGVLSSKTGYSGPFDQALKPQKKTPLRLNGVAAL